MTDGDLPADAGDLPIPDGALRRAASDAGDVTTEELIDTLVVLDADLRGRHSTYEAEYEHVTVDGVRAYLADEAAWKSLLDEFDLDDDLAVATRAAHTDGARILVDESVDTPQFTPETVGIVIGVDTAEEMT
jgi:hypothetical protein